MTGKNTIHLNVFLLGVWVGCGSAFLGTVASHALGWRDVAGDDAVVTGAWALASIALCGIAVKKRHAMTNRVREPRTPEP